MNKILLFDFDGTIADSFENFIEILPQLAKKHNFSILSREELEKYRTEENLIKVLNIPFYKIPFIGRDMKLLQQKHITDLQPINGLPEVLYRIKNTGYLLGIVTSNSKENVEIFLRKNNIDIFTYMYTDSSMFGKAKVLQNFLKKHSLTKEEVLYVGDEVRDIRAAQNVGIQIIAVTWGFNAKEGLAKYQPDFLIDTPKDLLRLLEGTL